MTSERRALEIAILVCPGYMPVDIIGFHTAFGLLPDVNLHLVWKNLDEIAGMPYFPTRATTTFEDCPADLDVLYAGAVPPEIFEDEDVLAFLADRGSRATWVAGVCAGSLLLGAAGLLLGYRATTNFQLHDNLAHYGAYRRAATSWRTATGSRPALRPEASRSGCGSSRHSSATTSHGSRNS